MLYLIFAQLTSLRVGANSRRPIDHRREEVPYPEFVSGLSDLARR
jgi:hypothetical protein